MRRIAIVVVPLILLVAAAGWFRARSSRDAGAGEYDTVAVERGDVLLTVSGDGILKPRTTVQIKSYAAGPVEKLAVEVGDVVEQGDLIARIDPTDSLASYNQALADLSAAKARLHQAEEQARVQPAITQASIAQAEASYVAAQKNLAELENAIHPQRRTDAKAALTRARSNLALAKAELERTRGLKARGFVSQNDVDAAVNRWELAKAELSSARRQWDTLDEQLAAELDAAKAQVAQAKAALDRARADAIQPELKKADVISAKAQVARAEASVTNAKTTLDYTTITAPRAGVILQKYVEQGTIVTSGRSSITQGTDIVLLGDLSEMLVEVSLDEADVGKVRAGQPATITVDAFPEKKFQGRIIRVDPQATTQQNVTTVLVTVRVVNPGTMLKPGMTASCDFVTAKAVDVLTLPPRAVQGYGRDRHVFVRRGEEVVSVPVTVGLAGDERIEIKEGVKEGMEVLVPLTSGAGGDRENWARERGRRMGGAGGFIRQGSGGGRR